MNRCRIPNCKGRGKLTKNGERQFVKGFCNSCYQKKVREADNRRAVYYGMLNRCANPKNDNYAWYGGKGITVDLTWLPKNNGFKNFCRDMGERPKDVTPNGKFRYSLDRIDNNGPYSANNCRWVNWSVQGANRREPITPKKADTFYVGRFRGVSFSKYTKKNNKIYTKKSSQWGASLCVDGVHYRKYFSTFEEAKNHRIAMEIEFLGGEIY